MGRLMNDILQKFIPSAKKAIRIRFRRKNGRWLEIDVPPGKESFHFGKDTEQNYRLDGIPDIEDATGQREYMFFEGIPYPIKSHTQHPDLLVMGREAGNQQIMLINAEERGFQKALLLKGGKKQDFMFWILIIAGINLLVSIAMAFTIFAA
jgi:hypothetical protein